MIFFYRCDINGWFFGIEELLNIGKDWILLWKEEENENV